MESMNTTATETNTDRATAIAAIKASLRQRSGKMWSVTGGRGTSWGWLTIDAPASRQVDGQTTAADREELARLLSLSVRALLWQGVSVPGSPSHYREYMNRAAGKPFVVAEAYWD